jgi:hypothetical protein
MGELIASKAKEARQLLTSLNTLESRYTTTSTSQFNEKQKELFDELEEARNGW